ncbi:hypothetical protein [Piscinibacter sakaiensis]|uniref:hypothetical protein n=1 Tax=Piscinibacter sakaiensis TaxID=1547922 RepID=UPI003AAE3827
MAHSPAPHPPRRTRLRRLGQLASASAALALLAGCVVAPLPGHHGGHHPRGAVYVAPTHASPGHGYVWGHHHRRGWGWRHPHRGWHRGWR